MRGLAPGLLAWALGLLPAWSAQGGPRREEPLWVTGYYAAWRQDYMRPEEIDFGAVTHLVHFGVWPRPDGTLDGAANGLTPEGAAAAVRAAHAHGRRILFTVGGQGSRAGFAPAISDARRPAFIRNLVRFMASSGYDGIDVDMEEVLPEDAPTFRRFVRELRRAMDGCPGPRRLLTAAVAWEPALFAELSDQFDQINIMTYNLSGPYAGWVTWHSAPVYDGGARFPDGKARLPSIDGQVEAFLSAGVPRRKLGIGICFNGYVWGGGGVNGPRQLWLSTPRLKVLPYHALADLYGIREYDYRNAAYRWDEGAQAAYLSVAKAGSARAEFVSYDNEVSVRRKVRYAKERGIGGVIIWDLSAGYRAGKPEGGRDALLQAIRRAVTGLRQAR